MTRNELGQRWGSRWREGVVLEKPDTGRNVERGWGVVAWGEARSRRALEPMGAGSDCWPREVSGRLFWSRGDVGGRGGKGMQGKLFRRGRVALWTRVEVMERRREVDLSGLYRTGWTGLGDGSNMATGELGFVNEVVNMCSVDGYRRLTGMMERREKSRTRFPGVRARGSELGWGGRLGSVTSASKNTGRIWDPCVFVQIASPRAMWQWGLQ